MSAVDSSIRAHDVVRDKEEGSAYAGVTFCSAPTVTAMKKRWVVQKEGCEKGRRAKL